MDNKARSKYIHFRASATEEIALDMIARREDVNLSEAARLAVREAAQRRGLMPIGFLVEKPQDSGEVRQP